MSPERHEPPRREEDRVASLISKVWPLIMGAGVVIGSWYQTKGTVAQTQMTVAQIQSDVSAIKITEQTQGALLVAHDKQIALIQQDIGFIKNGVGKLLRRSGQD